MNHTARLNAARGGENHFGLGIINARGQFLGGKATKHNRMNGANARASQHGHHSFRDHRHIDDHAITLGHAIVCQHGGQCCNLIAQLAISESRFGLGDGAVVNNGAALTMASLYMAIERIPARVAGGIRKPATINALAFIKNLVGLADPLQLACRFGPKGLRIFLPGLVNLPIAARHLISSRFFQVSPCDKSQENDIGFWAKSGRALGLPPRDEAQRYPMSRLSNVKPLGSRSLFCVLGV